jgi:hypothetical protein
MVVVTRRPDDHPLPLTSGRWIMIRVACLSLSLISATLSGAALAQVNPAFADVNAEIEMVRSLVRVERRTVIEQAMDLLPSEAQAFWPIYSEYEAEKANINDRTVKLITDYAAAYSDLDDARAKALLGDSFQLEADLLALHRKYARRLEKVLPERRIARFMQIERKLDSVINLGFAEQIPLVR